MKDNFLVENRILRLRAGIGLPQWKTALAVGINASRLSLLEQGAPPRPAEIEKLRSFFKVEPAEIWPQGVQADHDPH